MKSALKQCQMHHNSGVSHSMVTPNTRQSPCGRTTTKPYSDTGYMNMCTQTHSTYALKFMHIYDHKTHTYINIISIFTYINIYNLSNV